MDVQRRVFTRGGHAIPLAPKTFDLLVLLVQSDGRAVSKQELMTACAYVQTDDIDPERHVNAGPINDAMEAAVRWAIAALENPTGAYTDFHRANIQTVFSSMISTHGQIRKVLAAGWQNPESIDALCRPSITSSSASRCRPEWRRRTSRNSRRLLR